MFAVPAAGLKPGHVPVTGFFAAPDFFHQSFHNYSYSALSYRPADWNHLSDLTRMTRISHLSAFVKLTRMSHFFEVVGMGVRTHVAMHDKMGRLRLRIGLHLTAASKFPAFY